MSVQEVLMRPGSGELSLTDDAPLSLTQAIYNLVTGVGCHVVITPTPLDPTTVSDATMLSAAMYTGRVIARPDRTSIAFTGLSSWLDSYTETVFSRTAGTPTQWLGDCLLNNITTGTVSGGSNVTRSFPALAQTRRQILDAVASEGGWEYEFRPNFTVNAGTSVFVSTPTVVITNKDEGPDGTYTGLLGGFTDTNVDASNVATKVIALGTGVGSSIVTGTATKTPALKTQNGSTPTLVFVANAPSANATNAATVASTVNTSSDVVVDVTVLTDADRGRDSGPGWGGGSGRTTPTRTDGWQTEPPDTAPTRQPNTDAVPDARDTLLALAIAQAEADELARLTSLGRVVRSADGGGGAESQFVRRVVRPGDNVYVYDLESGLVNTAQQITYRGEVIFPMTKRVLSMTWAIEAGYGVYIRSNASTPVWYDLTPYMQWEDPGATLEVGDRPASSYSSTVNRDNPAIEDRITDEVRVGGTWRRAANQSIPNNTLTNITLDTEDFDSAGYCTPISATITIPTGLGGVYAISATITYATGTLGNHYVQLSISGGTTLHPAAGPSGPNLQHVTAVLPLAAGATIVLQTLHNNGAAQNATAAVTVQRLSA